MLQALQGNVRVLPHADEIRKQLKEEEKANAASASAADDSSKSVADQVIARFKTEDGGFDMSAYQKFINSFNNEEDKNSESKKEPVILYDEKQL